MRTSSNNSSASRMNALDLETPPVETAASRAFPAPSWLWSSFLRFAGPESMFAVFGDVYNELPPQMLLLLRRQFPDFFSTGMLR